MMLKVQRVFTLLLLTTLLLGCAAKEAAQDEARPAEETSAPRVEMPVEQAPETQTEAPTETTPKALEAPTLIAPIQAAPEESPAPKDQTAIERMPVRMAAPRSAQTSPRLVTRSLSASPIQPRALTATTEPVPVPSSTPKMAMRATTAAMPTNTAPAPTESAMPETESVEPLAISKNSKTVNAEEVKAALEKASEEESDYKVVKVFYGTDRKVATGITMDPLRQIPWSLVAMILGGITIVVCLLCVFWLRGKKAIFLPLLLLLFTAGAGTASVLYPYQSKPEIAKTDVAYGNERGEFELGTCEVSIPKTHQLAELEAPSVFKFEINEDPTKHVVLLGINRMEEGPFLDDLRETVANSLGEEAFVFVHGYNVTFENAARRTAQLAYDLNFKGAPIFYSWPSQGGLLQYTIDETNVVWTVPHLKEFLRLIAKQANAKRVHLIAHSMGNRALTSALEKLSYSDAKDGPIFNEVILTAPDIDAEIFRRDLAPRVIKTAERVTLYASSNDEALVASKKVHGYPRAGESGEDVVVVEGIDTIDVSQLDTSLLGHSYYGSNDTVLVDMAQLLLESKPPTLRTRLQAMTINGLNYWAFFVENLRAELRERTGTAR